MVIRHAEKPEGINQGVTESGNASKHDLIVRGWQRAGALVCFFAPPVTPPQSPLIAEPEFLFASAPGEEGGADAAESKSNRPSETLLPLSRRLNVEVDTSFKKGQETELAVAVQACPGVVLIAWQHENINDIVNAVPGRHDALPPKWPGDRFDVVYVLDLNPATGEYQFSQVTQCLLDGDDANPIGL